MHKRAITVIGLLTLTFVSPESSRAEDVPISLQAAVEKASQGNRALQATRARAQAAHSRSAMADRAAWPRVSFSSQLARSNDPAAVFVGRLMSGVIEERDFSPSSLNDPAGRSQLSNRLSIEAPLDAFGRFAKLRDASRAMAGGADAAGQEQALDLTQQVTEAYGHASVARESMAVMEAAVAAARSRETEIEARVSEGAALRADLLRARARRREREADLAARRADAAQATAGLNMLLGAPEGTTYVPSALPVPASGPVDEDAVLVARAFSNRPGLEAMRLRAEAATGNAEADRRTRLPEVGVFAQLSDERGAFAEGRRSYAVGGFLRVSLFDPARSARQAEAQLAARAAELDRLAALDEVRGLVLGARARVLSGIAATEAARGGAEEGREALRVVRERRREGLATLTDELETEAAALSAQLRELSAQVDLAIAQAALNRATGESQ